MLGDIYLSFNSKRPMATIPAGTLIDKSPLTGMEAAVLISADGWAKENTDWYNYRSILKGGMIFSVIIILAGFAISILSIVGILLFVLLLILFSSSKPTSMKFPRFAATAHNLVDWKGNYHFITKNQNYFTTFNVREGLANRKKHDSTAALSVDEWQSGDDEFHYLSLNSFNYFIKDEKQNLQLSKTGTIYNQPVQILHKPRSFNVLSQIIPEFPNSHFGEDVSHFANVVDSKETSESRGIFDWIDTTLNHNINSIDRSIQEIYSEKAQYESWVTHVKSRCEQISAVSFDSTKLGWDNSMIGLNQAEKSLEQSVASDVIAQEQAIKREMENSEAKLREKRADFELQIAENHEILTRKSHELEGMITAQQVTLTNIQSIDVNPVITMQSKYGVTSGGGGSVGNGSGYISGVSTSIQTDYYDIENPAYKTMLGFETLAKGELQRSYEIKKGITAELGELDGAFQRRNEQMKKQQEERLKEIEVAKQRALHAIRKDSREVISIKQMGGTEERNPWADLTSRNLSIWLRPFYTVSNLLQDYNLVVEQFEHFRADINNESNLIIDKLRLNTTGQYQYQTLIHHWVVINGKAFSEIQSLSPIVFEDSSKLQIEVGDTFNTLGLNKNDIFPKSIQLTNLESCLLSLASRGAISDEVYQLIIKFKKICLKGVLQ